MNRFFKLLMSVVAVAGTLACTTDVTEDLSVKVGGKTQLTLSFDNTRTEIGAKDNGVYPLTWSENDQVSVNGIASDKLTVAEGAGTANATFTFGGELTTPYCVAFPAAAAGQVMFAAVQNHTSNTTFDSKAAAMYGYSKDGENIQLKHLTGILKLTIAATEEMVDIKDVPKLSQVRISTIDRKPIAGAFNINFETGELTPTKESTDVITYQLDDYLLAPGTSVDVHIAVPAGVYDELYVTVEDNKGGVMYKTVKAYYNSEDDDKSLKPGKVREFTNSIVFEPIDTNEVFVIKDYESLVAFKTAIEAAQTVVSNTSATDDEKAAATAILAKDAVFANDVQIPNEPIWGTIIGTKYVGTVIGNGYAIKGLNAPLFNITAASFKGLHIEAAINETSNPNSGTFARRIAANGNAPVVEDCTASGTITINTAYTGTADVIANGATGGFTGRADGVHFKNCTSSVAITVNKISDTVMNWASVGGITGFCDTANKLFVNFTNCTNDGVLKCNDSTGLTTIAFGGIVGTYRGASAEATFDNCENNGAITVADSAKSRACSIGGLHGYTNSAAANIKNLHYTDCVNNGAISVGGTHTGTVRVGGIIGNLTDYTCIYFDGTITNNGTININPTSGTSLRIGGIIGQLYTKCLLYTYADVKNSATADITIGGSSSDFYCGGILGYNEYSGSDKNNTIYLYGHNVANDGDITINISTSGTCAIGGYCAYSHNSTTNLYEAVRLINTGKMFVTDKAVIANNMYLGGIAGNINGNRIATSTLTTGQVVNKGEVRFEGEGKKGCYIGGVYGCHYGSMTVPTINTGNVYALGKFDTTQVHYIAGLCGRISYALSKGVMAIRNIQCYCDIEAYNVAADGTVTPHQNVGMITGFEAIATTNAAGTRKNFFGGRVAVTATVDNGKVTPTWVPLTADNYVDYTLGVRGVLTDASTLDKVDGVCILSLITSVDDIVWGNFGN